MICQHCKAENPEGMKFCTSCGKPLSENKTKEHNVCGHCKTENPVGSKFCSNCGRPLDNSITDSQNSGWITMHKSLIDRILKYITVACFVIAGYFIYLRSNFTVEGPVEREICCNEHCVNMYVSVHDKYHLVSAYDIEEFNVIYPCPYVKKGSFRPIPKPLNNENLHIFKMKSVELYQIRATAQAALWAGIAVFFFLIRKFTTKRKEN